MPKSDRYTGRDLSIVWENIHGHQALDGDFRSLDVDFTADTIDGSAGNDAERHYLEGLHDATADIEVLDSGGTTITGGSLERGQEGTLVWGPLGSVSGRPKHAIAALITGLSVSYPYDDMVALSVSLQCFGTMVTPWAGTFN